MNQNELTPLNSFGYYFIKSLEFYTLKKQFIPRVCFILNLLGIFFAFQIPSGLLTWQTYSLYFIIFSVISVASFIYLFSCIKEFRGKEYTSAAIFKRIRNKFILIIFSSFMFDIAGIIGIFVFIFPGIYFISVFFLNSCYIIDLGENLDDSFGASRRLTKPYRDILMKYFLFLLFIIAAVGYMFLSLMATSGSELIMAFAISFYGSAAVLVYQRFISYLYMDIEYKRNAIKFKKS